MQHHQKHAHALGCESCPKSAACYGIVIFTELYYSPRYSTIHGFPDSRELDPNIHSVALETNRGMLGNFEGLQKSCIDFQNLLAGYS